MTKVQKAYVEMVTKIESGMEYPEAHTQVAVKYNLTKKQAQAVTALYDERP